MRKLILMRHAQAEPSAASGRDRDRPLSAQGRAEAIDMGRLLAERGLSPDRALVSPAARTRETWDLMHAALGDAEVGFDAALYNGSAETLRTLIEAEEETAGQLLVLGHNPGVQILAHTYLIEGAASPSILERMAGGFPTAAMAVFDVDVAGRPLYDGFFLPRPAGEAA